MNKEVVLPADEWYIPAVQLRAGAISAMYEKGRLRYITAGGVEIVRMIYPALRDADWNTVASVKNEEKISRQQQSFSISYSALYEAGEVRYRAFCKIEGRVDNTVIFSIRGEALGDFHLRRVGLCLLHPVTSCAGRDVEVYQPDGSSYSAAFPEFVSPFQVFLNVQRIKWLTDNNVLVQLSYEGGVFETEDQRNWSDNSYKTYGPPLSASAPAFVRRGDTFEQRITLQVETGNTAPLKDYAAPQAARISLPSIGYARAPDQQPLTPAQVALLKKIPFHHYRVEVDLRKDWQTLLGNALTEAQQLDVHLELAVIFNKDRLNEVEAFAEAVAPAKAQLFSVLILEGGHDTCSRSFYEQAHALLKGRLGSTPIGYGTSKVFGKLNKNRPAELDFDFISFHLHPQAHTFDTRSIMDNLGSHETLIASASKLGGGKPVHVSPVCLAANGLGDKRLQTCVGAWWMLQALRNLGAAASVSFFHLTGPMGIIDDRKTTPIYAVLKTIGEFAPEYIYQHTGEKVIFENAGGEQLIFHSKLPPPYAAR